MKFTDHCFGCDLCKTRHNIVWGQGPSFARIMFVAEGPGEHEDLWGVPFYFKANAGQEYDRLLGTINLDRANVYTTNTVKCRPPGNRDPYPDEIAACRNWLLMEIGQIQPKIIVTVGAISTKSFLGNVNMEAVHGIPFETAIKETGQKVIVIPVYHPAAGLRSPEYAQLCALDFANVGAVLRGKLSAAHFQDPLAGSECYGVLQSESEVIDAFEHSQLIAVDTETLDWKYTPYIVSASTAPGSGYVIFADNAKALAVLAKLLADEKRTTLIHNCLFDIFVLEKLGIYPANIHDTMIMAYLLQSEPQGLKPLAFRYWGMIMKDYEDMVAEASATLAAEYLHSVIEYTWLDPEKILEIKPGGKFHYRQPQNIAKVVARILKDLEKGKIGTADLWRRWHKLDLDETGRSAVEAALGDMPAGNLSMVPREDAVWYACRDADATIRVHPYLWSRILDTGMEEVFHMDMGIVPMVKDMMQTGIKPIPEELARLGGYFGRRLEELEAQITALSNGEVINVGSPLQVAHLLFDRLHLRTFAKHGKISTNDKTLARLVAQHPVVPLIRNWRTYSKLKSTYTDKLSGWIAEDGRIHTTIKLTRTSTGRLCVHPDTLIEAPRDMEKYPNGIPLRELKSGDYVYSFDWKRELVVRRVKWVGPTQTSATVRVRYQAAKENAPVLELLVSPEHLVRLYNGKWQHAGDLRPGERLLCMVNRHNHGQGYFSFYSHSKNRRNGQRGGGKIKEHRFVYSQVHMQGAPLGPKTIVHHKDGRPGNNLPSNLKKVLTIADHQILHRMSQEEYEQVIATKVGRRGTILKDDTIRVYRERLRNLQLEAQGLAGVNHVVLSVEPGPETELWDLEVEDTHTFIGNEVALHNSSADPNLMNQPTRSEDGKAIRKAFTARDGCYLVSNDLSQIEMRLLAHESGDARLLHIFRNDLDIHSMTASGIFKLPIEELDEMKHRYPSKRVGFGVVYGITAAGLQEQLLMMGLDPEYWTVPRCQQLIDDWFGVYPDVQVYMEDLVAFARRHGLVQDMFGRRRYLATIQSSSKMARAEAARQAGNQPIQSGAAGVFKKGMANLIPYYRDFQSQGYVCHPIIPIHDDLVFEVSEDIVDIWVPIQQDVMEHSVTLKVPVKSDAKVGKIWGDQKKYKW